MKQLILLTSLLCAILRLPAQTPVEQANTAYLAKDYQQAAQLYETTLAENGASATLYYNLGNTYYRLNKIAPAILNYERALLLDPGNRDVRFNLEIARLKTVDKIEPLGEIFFAQAYNAVKNLYSANQWSRIAVACFLAFIICLFLFSFSRRIALKKIGFYAGGLLLLLCITGNIFAYNQKKKLTHRTSAIIFSPTTTIKSAPDNSGTDLFILHEGSKVQTINQLGEWYEIETADGNVGWISNKEIEII
jgi:tetratricopeptide (TPR) repeat protein